MSAQDFSETTIIDDGQMMYPVDTGDLKNWEEEHGKINASNYQEFCEDVECSINDVRPGSSEMIEICQALAENGSPVYRPE